jgi:hypothetical protein
MYLKWIYSIQNAHYYITKSQFLTLMGWWRNLSLIVVVCFLIGVHITIATVPLTVIYMIRDWSAIYSVWKERNLWMIFINVYLDILVFEVDAILGEDGSLV